MSENPTAGAQGQTDDTHLIGTPENPANVDLTAPAKDTPEQDAVVTDPATAESYDPLQTTQSALDAGEGITGPVSALGPVLPAEPVAEPVVEEPAPEHDPAE